MQHPIYRQPPKGSPRPAGWRCNAWNYAGVGTYLITLTLTDRCQSHFGSLVIDVKDQDPQKVKAHIACSPYGQLWQEIWQSIPSYHPEIKRLASQVMPDHFHGVLWVRRPIQKPIGALLRGAKVAFTQACRERFGEAAASVTFESGFHDVILPHQVAVQRAIRYVEDNPRRAAVKRLMKDYFKQLQHFDVTFPPPTATAPALTGTFQALGNRFLLEKPHFYQVQVSRRDFQFEPVEKGSNTPRKVAFKTATYEAKKQALFMAAKRGAVIVSPCISDGERALCRYAITLGAPVIQLKNQGFSPYFKPQGQLFEWCASGRYLLLVPIAWPYTPAKKALTRQDALILNRIAQWICGKDAATIHYHGFQSTAIDTLVKHVLKETTEDACPKAQVGVRPSPSPGACRAKLR